jgi:hypothetical protein
LVHTGWNISSRRLRCLAVKTFPGRLVTNTSGREADRQRVAL